MRRRSSFPAALVREGGRFRACCTVCDWRAPSSTAEVEASLEVVARHHLLARHGGPPAGAAGRWNPPEAVAV